MNASNQVILLESSRCRSRNPGVHGLQRQGPGTAGQTIGRGFNPTHKVRSASIQTFQIQPIVGKARRMSFNFVDVRTRLWQIQIERPGRVFKVIEDFDNLLPRPRDDLCLNGHNQVWKSKHKNDR